MVRIRSLLLGGALLALASCQDHHEAVAPLYPEAGARMAISDGARNAGNGHFYFLPPTVASRPSFSGTFDASALPNLAVEVCELSGSACTGAALATLTSTTEPYQAQIRADAARQHFLVYWNTAPANVSTAKKYRASVLASGQQLGYIDVTVVAKQKDLDKLDRNQYAGVVKGEWLQLVFRVEQGAVQANQAPTLKITSPESGASFLAGGTIIFRANASDPEDGDLTEKIVWTADGTTPLGTGASVSSSTLSAGTHTVIAQVGDLHGAVGKDSITLTITAANTAPIVTITAPAAGDYPRGATISFSGKADDPDEGELGDAALVWTSSVSGQIGTGKSFTRDDLPLGSHTITLTATDAGGLKGTATRVITVVPSYVSVPNSLSVPYAGTASLPITLLQPAPAGGLTLSVTSADPAKVGVSTPTVTIPAGQKSANATLTGAAPGTAVITAKSATHGVMQTTASVTAALDIVESSVSFVPGGSATINIRLKSGGQDAAAPAGGLTVTLTSADATCAVATLPLTIAQGMVSTSATVAYGGSATTPCNTQITASVAGNPAVATDEVAVTVGEAPALSIQTGTNTRVGAGLRMGSTWPIRLGAPAPTGGLEVTIKSSNAGVALVAPGSPANTVGAGTITLTVPAGQSQTSIYVDGVENQSGDVTITATAAGYTEAAATVTVAARTLYLSAPTTTTSLSPNTGIAAHVGVVNASGTGYAALQNIRPGGTPLEVSFTNSNSSVAQLVTNAGSAQTRTATIAVGAQRTPTTQATGGVEFDPLGAGTTTISASAPGASTTPQASENVTVSAPALSLANGTRVGSGLQRSISVGLGAPAPAGGLALTLTSSDTAVLRVAPDDKTAGTGTITLTVPAGRTSVTFYVQGMEEQGGLPRLTASAPGYTDGNGWLSVTSFALAINNLPGSLLNEFVSVSVGIVTASGQAVESQSIRAGGSAIEVTLSNSDASVGQLVTSAGSGQTRTALIKVGASSIPNFLEGGLPAGAVRFVPLGLGTTTVSASAPGANFSQKASQTVTVTSM